MAKQFSRAGDRNCRWAYGGHDSNAGGKTMRWKPPNTMTQEELHEWGQGEVKKRKRDLVAVKCGELSLKQARARAVSRRKAVGLSRGMAASLVSSTRR